MPLIVAMQILHWTLRAAQRILPLKFTVFHSDLHKWRNRDLHRVKWFPSLLASYCQWYTVLLNVIFFCPFTKFSTWPQKFFGSRNMTKLWTGGALVQCYTKWCMDWWVNKWFVLHWSFKFLFTAVSLALHLAWKELKSRVHEVASYSDCVVPENIHTPRKGCFLFAPPSPPPSPYQPLRKFQFNNNIIITLFKSQIFLAERRCSTNWGDCKSTQIKSNVGFWREGKTGVPREKPLGAE